MATVAAPEVQLTLLLSRSAVFEYVPVALNCWVSPAAMLGALGATAMDCRVTGGGGDDEPPPQAVIAKLTATSAPRKIII